MSLLNSFGINVIRYISFTVKTKELIFHFGCLEWVQNRRQIKCVFKTTAFWHFLVDGVFRCSNFKVMAFHQTYPYYAYIHAPKKGIQVNTYSCMWHCLRHSLLLWEQLSSNIIDIGFHGQLILSRYTFRF